jgi:hypothetical protein
MIYLNSTDDQRFQLRIVRYCTDVKAVQGGLMMSHFAAVHPVGKPESDCREVRFSIPAALQDEESVVLGRWQSALERLREDYEYPVDMDLRVPMDIWRRGQATTPVFVKEMVNEDSAPYNYVCGIPLIG